MLSGNNVLQQTRSIRFPGILLALYSWLYNDFSTQTIDIALFSQPLRAEGLTTYALTPFITITVEVYYSYLTLFTRFVTASYCSQPDLSFFPCSITYNIHASYVTTKLWLFLLSFKVVHWLGVFMALSTVPDRFMATGKNTFKYRKNTVHQTVIWLTRPTISWVILERFRYK